MLNFTSLKNPTIVLFMQRFKAIALSLAVFITSCSSSDTSLKEIEVLFRDRTEKNVIDEGFTVSLNGDVAQSAKFESVTVFPLISKLEIGDSFSLEFFGGLEGVLLVNYSAAPEIPRIIVEVDDDSISIVENESFELNGNAIKLNFVDKEAVFKNLLREALQRLKDAASERVSVSNANQTNPSDSMKKYNENFSRRLPSLNRYLSEIENFLADFPEFSSEGENLLSVVRSLDFSTGQAAVAIDTPTLNRHINAVNESLPLIEDAEFRLFLAIENRLKE